MEEKDLHDKIRQLRDLMHEVVNHPEVVADRDLAIVVKRDMTRNLGVLNAHHKLPANSPIEAYKQMLDRTRRYNKPKFRKNR